MSRAEPFAVVSIPTILGEGPVWSVEDGVLFWLDIFRPSINRYEPATGMNQVIPVGETIYAAGLASSGGFVASLEGGFALLGPDGRLKRHLLNPNDGRAVNFNDGCVDRRGRFWSGTMAKDWNSPIGSLWRLERSGAVVEVVDGVILANGIGFSPDDRVLYFTDFAKQTVFAYPFDITSGDVGSPKEFIVLPDGDGSPDGITVDAEGHVWVAHWDGWCVTRHDPNGHEIMRIQFPVQRPTSVAFGGPNLETLYVTSATMGLSPEELASAPLSGSLFAIDIGIHGLPQTRFVDSGSEWEVAT